MGHAVSVPCACILFRTAALRTHIVKVMFNRLLTLIPALALTLLYGRATGDFENTFAVMALLLGMGIGVQIGRRRARTEG